MGWCPVSRLQATHLGISTDQRSDKDAEDWVPDSEERLILREEFTSRMHQRFLDGKDGGFDYRCLPAPPHPAQHPGSQAGPCLSSKEPSLVLARVPSNSSPPRVLVSVTLEVSDQRGEEAGSRPNLVPLGALPSIRERRGELSQPKAQCDKAQWGTPVPAREHDETLAQGRERQRGGGEKSTCPHPGPVTWELCPQIASVAQGS